MSSRKIARSGLLLGLGLALIGCARERAPINRVQAGALSKKFFVGNDLARSEDDPEFYHRNYVIGASVSQSLVGVGSWSAVDRIRWEITEKSLLARKAYEASGHAEPVRAEKGAIVAAYDIESHFDIRRGYNQTTGEEQNVIEENDEDRPWFARELMRVDWSTNRVNDPMWEDMFIGSVTGAIQVTPETYVVTDPSSEDAPHFEPDDGYFDVTHHYLVEPAEVPSPFSDVSGKVPACLVFGAITGSATYDCNPQEAVVRSSFKRIDPDDFEPLENTVASRDVVGNPGGLGHSGNVGTLTAGLQGWDPAYGYVDAHYHRLAHIHDIWRESHQDAPCHSEDDADANGTADECEDAVTGYRGSRGSQCDVLVGRCTLPYRDRRIETVDTG